MMNENGFVTKGFTTKLTPETDLGLAVFMYGITPIVVVSTVNEAMDEIASIGRTPDGRRKSTAGYTVWARGLDGTMRKVWEPMC